MKSILNSYYEYMNKAKEERGKIIRELPKNIYSLVIKEKEPRLMNYCCVALTK